MILYCLVKKNPTVKYDLLLGKLGLINNSKLTISVEYCNLDFATFTCPSKKPTQQTVPHLNLNTVLSDFP